MCKHPVYMDFFLSEVGNRILKRQHMSGRLRLEVNMFNQRGPTVWPALYFCSKWTSFDPLEMNTFFPKLYLTSILCNNSIVCWTKKPSTVLLRMGFKDSFLVLKAGKEHTWQLTNNKPVEVSYFSKRVKCLQTEHVFRLPLSPSPGR